MSTPNMKPAQLEPAQMEQVHSLEKNLGSCVVAWDVKTPYAELTPEQLRQLQAAEKQVGKILLAYECRPS